MGFDQSGPLVFKVARDMAGVWSVKEEGFDHPLASFGSSDDASQYAFDIASSKDGSIVKIYDDQGKQVVSRNEATQANELEYSRHRALNPLHTSGDEM